MNVAAATLEELRAAQDDLSRDVRRGLERRARATSGKALFVRLKRLVFM